MTGKRKIAIRGFYVPFALFSASVIAYTIFWASSEAKLREARSNIEKPAAQVFHERLVAKRSGERLDGPIANDAVASTPYAGLSDEDIEQSLAAWARIVEPWEAWRRDFVHDPTWNAAAEIVEGPNRDIVESDWTVLVAVVEKHRELLPEIRAAAKLGGPVYPLDFSKGDQMSLQHLGPLKSYAELLIMHAKLQSRRGDFVGALIDFETGIQLAEALAGDPYYISQLARLKIHASILSAARETFPPDLLTEARARKLVRLVDIARNARPVSGVLLSGAQLGWYDLHRRSTGSAWDPRPFIFERDNWTGPERFGRWLYGSPLGRPWRARHDVALVQFLTDLDDLIDEHHDLLLDELDSMQSRTIAPAVFMAVGPEAASLRYARRWSTHSIRCNLPRIGFSIEWHYAQHGHYPETLSDIVDELGGTVPIDPFSGEEYRYIVSEDSFVLYSLGADVEDDGGLHDLVNGDIVWRGVEDAD